MPPSSAPSASSLSGTRRAAMTDGDVYVFTLQTAFLEHLLQSEPRVRRAPRSVPMRSTTPSVTRAERPSLSDRIREMRLHSSATGSVPPALRFPDKFLRKLTERLERIAMGRDPFFCEPEFRQTIGAFYGALLDDATYKRLKETRSVETLLAEFTTYARTMLKKRIVNENALEHELEKQRRMFVRVVHECLRAMPGVSRELLDKVDQWYEPSGSVVRPRSSSATESVDNMGEEDEAEFRAASVQGASASPLVLATGRLFDFDEAQVRRDVQSVSTTCSLTAGIVDLKRCIYFIHAQKAWPGCPDDFTSLDVYKQWRSSELVQLSQLMTDICRVQPDLLSAASTSDSSSRQRASMDSGSAADLSGDSDASGNDDFTYIPPDSYAAYQRLHERCIDRDLDVIRHAAASENVPVSILSPTHTQLLAACAKRWRVPPAAVHIAHLRVCRSKYDAGEVPLECVVDALDRVETHINEVPTAHWRRAERDMLAKHVGLLTDSLVRVMFAHMSQPGYTAATAPLAPELALCIALSERAHALTQRLQPGTEHAAHHAAMLRRAIRTSATHTYAAQAQAVFRAKSDILDGFADLLDWLEKQVKAHSLRTRALLGVAPANEVARTYVPMYIADLASVHKAILLQVQKADDIARINDALSLFHRVRALIRHCEEDVPSSFDVCVFFRPFVDMWLDKSQARTAEWIRQAVQSDTFERVDAMGAAHSSSMEDMSDALQQPLLFIESLAWPREWENAQFFSRLARAYGRFIEQYCQLVAEQYMRDMAAQANAPEPARPDIPTHAAWVARAKQAMMQGDRHMEPFVLQARSCVMLNNMEAARKLLDTLYHRMDADKQADIVAQHARDACDVGSPDADDSGASTNFASAPSVFSVKIVQAELPNIDTPRLDTFVTLSDARGTRLAKTRTIFDASSPRWDEVVDLSFTSAQWVSAAVWHRLLHGEPVLFGRASVCLDPRLFTDVHTHDEWLSLDGTGGKLLLRVSMEDTHDGILFSFGTAFRVVKRTEVDMTRALVDHISLYMRHILSRPVLASLVRGGRVDRALGNVRALYATALAQANGQVPARPKHAQSLTDHEIEAAIVPLLDYLDETLGTLHSSLSESQAQFVLTRVWKEVLATLEGLLVPPLSDAPTKMRQLSDKEVDVVFKWLSFLRSYFHAYDVETGEVHGVPLAILQGPKYRELLSYLLLHDQSTDALMIECVRSFQARLVASHARSKSVLQQRSLGTIQQHKKAKHGGGDDAALMSDMAMKILRMRPGTGDFLTQQLASLHTLQSPAAQAPTKPPPPPASSAPPLSLRRMSRRLGT